MGKRKVHSKRSLGRLPKGLPVRNGNSEKGKAHNPFELNQSNKRPKFEVHNRMTRKSVSNRTSALQEALATRKAAIQMQRRSASKSNQFTDRRLGDPEMTVEQQNLARLVRERSRQSQRQKKYSLAENDGDDEGFVLTHKGKAVDSLKARDHVFLSDDEDEGDKGYLDAVDTEAHFGGGGSRAPVSAYGPASTDPSLSDMYSRKKTDLDYLILRRKIQKAERLKSKEDQVETFEAMDESFKELAGLLQFRNKKEDLRKHEQAASAGTLPAEDQEMEDWDKEMRTYLHATRKVQASNRTMTPEEIAKREADRLHELETRRLARMNGDFQNDDFSDLEEDDKGKKKKRKQSSANKSDNPEALDDSDDESDSDDKPKVRFTSEGLVHVDKNGEIIGKVGEEEAQQAEAEDDSSDDDDDDEEDQEEAGPLAVGSRVTANYHANEQYDEESWYPGVIAAVHQNGDTWTYDVDYDDGDFENGVEHRHVRTIKKTAEELEKEQSKKEETLEDKRKRQLAKEKARSEIPFVLEVPTTLEALHDMIGNYAKTGEDVSVIIRRIHATNSVRLDRRNAAKMQNFYDVLLRRFVAVGDAIHNSGDGGTELSRYKQLDTLTATMYGMAQDSPVAAGAVWSRRLGIFQNAHAKRLRDAELERDDESEFTAWPSTGVVLALRSLGHIFPVTDQRHTVVTPAMLLLGQFLAHTPVLRLDDLVLGIMCAGLLIEYTKEAKRVSPEAHAFLAGVIRLFAPDAATRGGNCPLPTLGMAAQEEPFVSLREKVRGFKGTDVPRLSLEQDDLSSAKAVGAALLYSALHLVETSAKSLSGFLGGAEKELFAEITESLLFLKPKSKACPLPPILQKQVASTVSVISQVCKLDEPRAPLRRRAPLSTRQTAIKSLAPRIENPDKYSVSKDKGKNATQTAADRTRREYKREHKAISRELRLDAAVSESQRREEQAKKDNAARTKRQRAYAWMEGEQATLNQQVREGGGLLRGGGVGLAKAKAATAKLGIKKGGKF